MILPNRSPRHRGSATSIILILIVVLAAAMATAYFFGNLRSEADAASDTQLVAVRRGSFDITIPSSGELEALRQIEIRNQLESRSVITYIVDEGTTVQKGDELIHLAEEEIQNRIKDAVDAVKTARASLVAAQAKLEIQRSARDSDLDKAQLEVELSQLALKGWLDGEVVSKLEQLSLEWETAKINYERLRDKYMESIELEKEGFISGDELKRDEISMIEAKARVEQANLDIDVYTRYTYPQDEARMESAVEQAIAELDRVRRRHDAELETAQADVESKEHQLDSRQQRLDDLELQLSYCSVKAPSSGLVVYASSLEGSGRRGNDEQPPQVGTELRPNELVMVLPDTSQMIAAVKVNEALSGLVQPGQRATVVSDAMPGTSISGEVVSIGVLAEGGGWRDPNRRDYTVRIKLETEPGHPLKPSMRCKANINIEQVDDVLFAPIEAIFRESGGTVAYVPEGSRFRATPVQIGRASELYVEIGGGLAAGDHVLLRRPRPEELVSQPSIVLAAASSDESGRSGGPQAGGERPDGGDAASGRRGGGRASGSRPGSGRPSGARPAGGRPGGA